MVKITNIYQGENSLPYTNQERFPSGDCAMSGTYNLGQMSEVSDTTTDNKRPGKQVGNQWQVIYIHVLYKVCTYRLFV